MTALLIKFLKDFSFRINALCYRFIFPLLTCMVCFESFIDGGLPEFGVMLELKVRSFDFFRLMF